MARSVSEPSFARFSFGISYSFFSFKSPGRSSKIFSLFHGSRFYLFYVPLDSCPEQNFDITLPLKLLVCLPTPFDFLFHSFCLNLLVPSFLVHELESLFMVFCYLTSNNDNTTK